jgi:hypothetical protein
VFEPDQKTGSPMPQPAADHCKQCGELAPGKAQWMFDSDEPSVKEFFCDRCLGIMRIYAIIGFSLLGLLLLAFGIAVWVPGVLARG